MNDECPRLAVAPKGHSSSETHAEQKLEVITPSAIGRPGVLDIAFVTAIVKSPGEGIMDTSDKRPQQRSSLNAEGPFYTCGDCLFCGLPEGEAPDLLAPLTAQNSTTYFARQPQSPDEIERACRAIDVCCIADLRCGGSDPSIIRRLRNLPLYCDFIIRGGKVVRADSMEK